ncbi:MAG: hypothetical protein QM783_06745 [Phycisphaerales bacterium]
MDTQNRESQAARRRAAVFVLIGAGLAAFVAACDSGANGGAKPDYDAGYRNQSGSIWNTYEDNPSTRAK